MRSRWSPTPAQTVLCQELAQRLNISALLAQCLLNRNLQQPELISGFLEPRLKHLADPFLLPDMSTAVERLYRARSNGETVVIFGDYDVDGVTATALLYGFLQTLGWNVHYHLPHRLDEGYGLTVESVQRCLKKTPATLMVCLDCGSNSVECIQSLQEQSIDVIVVDHHQVSALRPAVVALVNPRSAPAGQDTSVASVHTAPFAELCSVGLAFKVAHAVVKRARQLQLPIISEFDLRPLLDLVALGTIADLVPLTGENRILVCAGLERLNRTERPGLVALKSVARVSAPVGTYEVGFQLAPRLNAAGRLETAEEALGLLLSMNRQEAFRRAEALEERNRERQQVEREIAAQVIERVRAKFNPKEDFVIVEGHLLWHVGVVGIVASRILREFHRPTIIVGGEGEEWRGSGRSIAPFDLAGALGECADVLVRHGGHAMAAGLTVRQENLDALRIRLNEVARQRLKPEELSPVLRLDAEVSLKDITLECVGHLARLNPTGQGNPPVHFFAKNLSHQRPLQRVGGDKHVKIWATDGQVTREAIWWGAASESLPEGRYDLAFTPQINEFNGQKSVQLKVLDWRPAGP